MIKHLSFTNVILCILLLRIIIFGASFGDALAFLGICATHSYLFYLNNKKEIPINQEVKEEISQMRQEHLELKSQLNSLKLGNVFGSTNNVRR